MFKLFIKKIAGVQIGRSSQLQGKFSSIQIRGASSIGSVSSPLFLLTRFLLTMRRSIRTELMAVDVGNRAGDISSDDIGLLMFQERRDAALLWMIA